VFHVFQPTGCMFVFHMFFLQVVFLCFICFYIYSVYFSVSCFPRIKRQLFAYTELTDVP
jgi:hypothetical protein